MDARTAFTTQVTLRVTLPVLVDRSEIVLTNGDGVRILEHERWGAPLDAQIISVLGQDIESRREDAIMGSRRGVAPGERHTTIVVDVVQLSLQRGSQVRLEARWRLQDDVGGKESQGRETFTASAADESVLALARSLDVCIGSLADRLVANLAR